jgi:hypothetical protein
LAQPADEIQHLIDDTANQARALQNEVFAKQQDLRPDVLFNQTDALSRQAEALERDILSGGALLE